MTASAELRKIMAPLLSRRDDIALVGRILYLKPIRHILRGVQLRSSKLISNISAQWIMHHTCFPSEQFFVTHRRFIADTSMIGTPLDAAFFDAIDRDLNYLSTIDTLEKYKKRLDEEKTWSYYPRHPLFYMTLCCGLGAWDDADAVARSRLVPAISEGKISTLCETTEAADYAIRLCNLLRDGERGAVPRLLREIEFYTAMKLKVRRFWQPGPFDYETHQ